MYRLLLYLGLSFLLLLTVSTGAVYLLMRSTHLQDTRQSLQSWQKQTNARIEQKVGELDLLARHLAGETAVQRFTLSGGSTEDKPARELLDALLRSYAGDVSYVNELCLIRAQDSGVFCTPIDPGGVQLSSQPLPAMTRNERLLFPAVQQPGEQSRAAELIHATPVWDRGSGVVKGVLLLSVNTRKLLQDIFEGPAISSLLLYDEKGTLLFSRHPEDREDIGSRIITPADYDTGLVQEGSRYAFRERLDVPQVAWYTRVEAVTQFSFYERKLLYMTLTIYAAGFMLLLLISWFLYKKRFAGPLERLRILMKRAELGDLKAYWIGRQAGELNELGEGYNQMLNRLEELIKQVKREEGLKKEAEMEALKYQLNPHFLYNTLNTIKWVAKMHRTPQIGEVVTALVRLLQASLGKKGDFITVREEVELLRDYMHIQTFRYGEKIKLSIEVDPLSSDCLLPCMLLQPLVENAIVHGIEPAKKDGLISIRVWVEPERDLLICEVEDNGIGLNEPRQEEAAGGRAASGVRERMSGIGLQHIREKIKLYYGNGYHMHLFGKPGEGTLVRLTLPVHHSGG
ncbi:sensor histidine kinase [Paenibacillus sp. GD4]|uniref:sensor histidine kinase n=1 Tax=Paenibacillus sp. GD4 TaxID=3068890 RepID=UPI0027966905|nr:sensor histidine kinase [Paenibacillus sp. GD4]MDQ1909192.1 sensor histidine kinase [Paenibacillus sp. GD4]